MHNIIFIICIIVGTSLMGCASNHDAISKISSGSRQDIFQVASASQADTKKALLKIEFSVKAYKARVLSSYIKHDDPPYNVVINIDDQVIELKSEPVLENLPGHFTENPEAGMGWKYRFRKTLQLLPGKHRICIAVPLADVAVEKELVLKEGNNVLLLSPIYNTSMISRPPHYPWFSNGLHSILIKLNGEVV